MDTSAPNETPQLSPSPEMSNIGTNPNTSPLAEKLQEYDKRRVWKRRIIGIGIIIISILIVLYINRPTAVKQIKISPTPTPPVINMSPTVFVTPPFSDKRAWLVTLQSTPFFSAAKLNERQGGGQGLSATLYTPLKGDAPVCMHSEATQSTYIEKRNASGGWERLCDQFLPTTAQSSISCKPYDATNGMAITGELYPSQNCASQNALIEPGSYRMHVVVFTNCSFTTVGNEDQCSGVVDLLSPQFEVGN